MIVQLPGWIVFSNWVNSRVSASGYIQGGYWNLEQNGYYGSRIRKISNQTNPSALSCFHCLIFFLALQWVMSTTMLSTSSTGFAFLLIPWQPTPFFPVSHRVDMDIAGTSNSLLRTSSKQVPCAWLDEDSDWGKIVTEQKIMKRVYWEWERCDFTIPT